MKHILHKSFSSFACLQPLIKKRAVITKSAFVLMSLALSLSHLQAQTEQELIIAPADGDYAWTTGTKSSKQLNALNDSIYFLDSTNHVAFDASVSTSAACPPAVRRVQLNAFDLILATNTITSLSILGTSSGSSDRTLRSLFVNEVLVPSSNYTVSSIQTGGSSACGYISVIGLNIPPQSKVTVVIGSTPTSTPQNYRVNVIYVNKDIALPVKLVDFQAQKQVNQRLLTWKIADGNEPATYTIERSQDGRSFSAIAVISSNGSSTLNYIDNETLSGSMIYYRLKVTEPGGAIYYSKVSALNIGSITGLQLTPNPVKTGLLYLTFGASESQSTLKLFNMAGQVMETRIIAPQREQASIETSQLKPGVYFVQLINGTTVQSKRFVKL